MKRRKLLAKLNRFLNQSDDRVTEQRSAMRKVLSALKTKERNLQQKIDETQDPVAREKLAKKLAICHAQRKKGVARLQALRLEKDGS